MTFYPPIPPSQPPIQVGYGRTDGRRRSNGMAIASLVLGVLGCIPFIPGALAILFGVIGIRKSREPSVGGQGLAVAGLVLGIISVLGWSGFGALFGYGYLESKPAGMVARQFLQDVCAGNINAAMTQSSGMTAAQLQANSQQMIPFGALQSVSVASFYISSRNGQTTMRLGGVAAFSNGTKNCTFALVKTGGIYKVTAYRVQ